MPVGRDLLIPAFAALMKWGDEHRNHGIPPITLTHTGCGSQVTSQLLCERGHVVSADAVEPEPGPGITG